MHLLTTLSLLQRAKHSHLHKAESLPVSAYHRLDSTVNVLALGLISPSQFQSDSTREDACSHWIHIELAWHFESKYRRV